MFSNRPKLHIEHNIAAESSDAAEGDLSSTDLNPTNVTNPADSNPASPTEGPSIVRSTSTVYYTVEMPTDESFPVEEDIEVTPDFSFIIYNLYINTACR